MSGRISQELAYFFSGLSFYTRIPCPKWVEYSPNNLNKSRKYLPLIGLFIGLFAALVFYISRQLLPASVSIVLSIIATVYLTGAFHEDGLADCADGFGGGWEKEQILSIMKDSRIGAYGTISLILMFGLKFVVLLELQLVSESLLMLALIVGHSLSRLMSSLTMQHYAYVSELKTSKSKTVTSVKLSRSEMIWSLFPLVIVMLLFAKVSLFVSTIPVIVLTCFLGSYYQKRIGGYTGDCLGATQQITEVFYFMILLMFTLILGLNS
jgi:adenosylcobinamide-GDP ribazoletransferase